MGLVDLLIYGFLFGAFLLFNYVSQRASRRRREQRQREGEAMSGLQPSVEAALERADLLGGSWGRVPQPATPADPLGSSWGRAPEPVARESLAYEPIAYERVAYEAAAYEIAPGFKEEDQLKAPPVPAARKPPAWQERRRPHLLRTRRDLRDAVVAMTVLGPCRALQPYEPGDAAPANRAGQGTGAP